jgi:hypothetical protein
VIQTVKTDICALSNNHVLLVPETTSQIILLFLHRHPRQDQPDQDNKTSLLRAGTTSSSDALHKEINSLANISSVSQVASSDQKSTAADSIGDVAESKRLLRGEVGDLAVLLLVASVAVEHDAGDSLLSGIGQTLHGSGHDGRALRVARAHNDGVGALGRGQLEEALGLAVGGARSAFGQSVLADAGGVGSSDALAGDAVGAVLLLEA